MTSDEQEPPKKPVPQRRAGKPAGPDEVRRAVLDASATLFAERGVDGVSLRDIASQANVHLDLIRQYIGNRDDLIHATFDDLSDQLAVEILEHPLEGHGFDRERVIVKWTRVMASLLLSGRKDLLGQGFNPVMALARTLEAGYGLDHKSARLRAAQITAAALGWRVFEEYLIASAELDDFPVETLREELVRSHRRLGATPWPSPPDPTPRSM
jgi:AcrR family transcriptional regulator